MTLARRLAKLEASRTPTEIVLAWLAEAHTYSTLPEYFASLTDTPMEAWPLGRIGAQVETAVRASVKGNGPDVWQAVRRSVGDAFVLFELVLHLNVDGRALRDVEGLRWALLTKWLGLLSTEAELAERTHLGDQEHALQEATDWRDVLALSLTSLYTEQVARASLEQAYFGNRSVLFPELAQDWADLVERLEWLTQHAQALPALRTDGTPVCLDELRGKAGESAQARVRELSLTARVEALEMLGEHERVAVIMERHLQALAEPASRGPEGGTAAPRATAE
ncbi:MAG: hypothetical protein ACLQHS_16205 [Candidatus Limnocylindrales bacterium]